MDSYPLTFLLKKLVSALILPPTGFLLCLVFGLLLLRRLPRLGRGLAWGGLLGMWLLSTPVGVDLLTRPLETYPALAADDSLEGAEAIVILGAGAQRYMPEYDGPAPNRLALERLRYGARLAKQTGLPVLLSGEIGPMAEAMWKDFNVEPRWFEGVSLDTEDNAQHTAVLLRQQGIRRVVLVTHAIHMRRALNEFTLAGVAVIPAPLGFLSRQAGNDPDPEFLDYLPGPTAAFSGWYAAHEWLGLLAQKLRTLVQ